MKGKHIFFVKTSTKNYIINLSITIIASIMVSVIIYRRQPLLSATFLIFFLYFLSSYRAIEYYLTGKSVIALVPIWGRIEEGAYAKFHAFLYFMFVFIITLYIVIRIYLLNK